MVLLCLQLACVRDMCKSNSHATANCLLLVVVLIMAHNLWAAALMHPVLLDMLCARHFVFDEYTSSSHLPSVLNDSCANC